MLCAEAGSPQPCPSLPGAASRPVTRCLPFKQLHGHMWQGFMAVKQVACGWSVRELGGISWERTEGHGHRRHGQDV